MKHCSLGFTGTVSRSPLRISYETLVRPMRPASRWRMILGTAKAIKIGDVKHRWVRNAVEYMHARNEIGSSAKTQFLNMANEMEKCDRFVMSLFHVSQTKGRKSSRHRG